MESKPGIVRRDFLRSAGSAAAGLLLAFHLPVKAGAALSPAKANSFSPNAFLSIHPDNKITVWITRQEMGQGVRTALPMMLADELEADWSTIELKQAVAGPAYKGIRLRTSGSGSIYGTWVPLRHAGATVREMLISAAAERWKVERDSCRAEKGSVVHTPTGRKLSYGELCEAASKLTPPEKPVLKDAKDFRFIGKPMKRVDGADIVSGKAVYGLDVKVPGMLYAAIERSPVLGGKAVRWDDSKAKAVEGVTAIVPVTTGFATGVAVIAKDQWAAMKGRDALKVTWDEGKNSTFSSDEFSAQLRKAAMGSEGYVTRKEGEVEGLLAGSASRLDATYEYPYQAHAQVETMNCVADVKPGRCEIWTGTQTPETVVQDISKMLGLPPEAIKVNVPLLGGGFGRRLQIDYVPEAVELSRAANAPVKVVWTRADDMRHGFFHSSTVCRMQASLDENKKLKAFTHKTASSDLSVLGPPTLDAEKYSSGWVPWGGYDSPYAFPAYRCEYSHVDSPVPTGPWRAVGYPQNVFARECFIDEVAHAMGKDPLEFRLELLDAEPVELGRMRINRRGLRRVLESAAEKSEWGKPMRNANGRRWGRGIACNVYHGETLAAQVAEVSVGADCKFKVERVVCVVDCGQVINPLGLAGQIESGIVWGLSPALHKPITFNNGRAEQGSYLDFNVLRMNEMPKVEVHALPNSARPSGIGEPAVPPIAPAVGNAIFAATGQRLRRLPFVLAK